MKLLFHPKANARFFLPRPLGGEGWGEGVIAAQGSQKKAAFQHPCCIPQPASRLTTSTSRQAFSLVEVMVAILILGIALVGMVHGINTALASSKESERQTVAALLAQGKIESLRAEESLTDGDDEGDCGAMFAMYHWKQTISATDIPGLHEVDVVVQQAQTQREIYELKTMLFQPDDDAVTNRNNNADSKSGKKPDRKK